MRIDHQAEIFEIIKRKIKGSDSIGNAVGEVLSISQDAVYRRFRGDTLLTIYEIEKLAKHFDFSIDALFEMNKNKLVFDFQAFSAFDVSMDSYLQSMLDSVVHLKKQKNPQLTISVNNTPFLQLLNFPHLVRFKLFFWAKTHLQIEKYKNQLFQHEKVSEQSFAIGKEVLRIYNSIPSREIYDPELLRGFTREIYYYFNAQHFQEPEYALFLLDNLDKFVDHLKDQAAQGKKFLYATQAPASGNDFEMYHNETLNATTTVFYKTDDYSGLFIAHNIMNTLHTTDQVYVSDSESVLSKQIANSSMISTVNEKDRNNYFSQVKSMINGYRKKIEADLEVSNS
jgi:hypothetical protein